MNAPPVFMCPATRASIAKSILKNTDATAANCGDFPKGAPRKKDQLASDKLNECDMSVLFC